MTTTAPAPAKLTLADIKAANKAAADRHFFDKGAKRFFNSQYLPTVYQGAGGVYFVTAERMDERFEYKYSVRSFDPATGHVDTAGEFNKMSKEDARAHAKLYAALRPSLKIR